MNILAYDPYPNKDLDVTYVSLDELFARADVISLHCPLTKETEHLINKEAVAKMKKGVLMVNTSRGGLIDSEAVIDGLFYEDRSHEIMQDENLARLTTFPNVIITSHMGFFTTEAIHAIAEVTLQNATDAEKAWKNGSSEPLPNEVLA